MTQKAEAQHEHGTGTRAVQQPTSMKPGAGDGVLEFEELLGGSQVARLREVVKKNPSALNRFFEVLTESNPELMQQIDRRRDEFVQMVTCSGPAERRPSERAEAHAGERRAQDREAAPRAEREPAQAEPARGEALAEPVREEAPAEAELAAERTERAEARRKELQTRELLKLRNSLKHTSRCLHSLATAFSPYSCAVCKADTGLMVCSSCRGARFCGRDHQRRFWPRHRHVCKFLAACHDALPAERVGPSLDGEAIPQILDMWTKFHRRQPEVWELEQLCRIPRCRVCHTRPAMLLCEGCCSTSYCSAACRDGDSGHRDSWQCKQVRLTAHAACIIYKHGVSQGFQVQSDEEPLSGTILESGFQPYMAVSRVVVNDVGFDELQPTVKCCVIDSLSYPLTILQGLYQAWRPIESLCAAKRDLDVHVLASEQTCDPLTNVEKFEEWLHRGGRQLRSLTLRFIGLTPHAGQLAHQQHDLSERLCSNCRQAGRRLAVHAYSGSPADWLSGEGLPAPAFRVSFAPCLGRRDSARSPWTPALKWLVAAGDQVPLVVTENTLTDAVADGERVQEAGMSVLVPARTSNFPSPLAVYDEQHGLKQNPTGLELWNMALAVFSACDQGAGPQGEDRGAADAGETRGCPFQAGAPDAAPTAHGARAFGELAVLRLLAETLEFHGDGCKDIDHSSASNPTEPFSVEFHTVCRGGEGYRSPLTSRDEQQFSGYMFYADPADRWVFWVGDGSYWVGITGPPVVMGCWIHLRGVVDTVGQRVELYVDGTLVGSRDGVSFATNTSRPLRLGAGRSEQTVPLFYYTGDVRELAIKTLRVQPAT